MPKLVSDPILVKLLGKLIEESILLAKEPSSITNKLLKELKDVLTDRNTINNI